MTTLTTREALTKALHAHVCGTDWDEWNQPCSWAGEDWDPENGPPTCANVDELGVEGAVFAWVATLADDEALVERVTREVCKPALNPSAYLDFTRDHLRALAAAIDEREATR